MDDNVVTKKEQTFSWVIWRARSTCEFQFPFHGAKCSKAIETSNRCNPGLSSLFRWGFVRFRLASASMVKIFCACTPKNKNLRLYFMKKSNKTKKEEVILTHNWHTVFKRRNPSHSLFLSLPLSPLLSSCNTAVFF